MIFFAQFFRINRLSFPIEVNGFKKAFLKQLFYKHVQHFYQYQDDDDPFEHGTVAVLQQGTKKFEVVFYDI